MEGSATSGRRLGRYHVGDPIGGGPTGEVFRARVHGVAGFEREFALKRFHASLVADEAARTSLRNAARQYAAYEHPRIARLHEYNFDTPSPYVTVEWIVGIDLGRLVDATFGQGVPLPAGAATAILSRAARAIGYLHGRGHAHLGLCPTNLLCTPAGEIKVTDCGFLPARLGRAPGDDETLRARIGFLAPEQLRGDPIGPATDVFGLGALLFQLLTGSVAFAGRTSREVSAQVLEGKPNTDAIPKPIARVLERCFGEPAERFQSGGALADAIDAAGRGLLMRGDQRDAAKAVQEALARHEEQRAQQVSGVLSFPIPAPPSAPLGSPGSSAAIASQRSLGVPNLELDEAVRDEATTDVLPLEVRLPPPIAASLPHSPPPPHLLQPTLRPTPQPAPAQLPAQQAWPTQPLSQPARQQPPTHLPPQSQPASTPSPSIVLPKPPTLLPPVPPPAFGFGDVDQVATAPFDREEQAVTDPLLEANKTPRQIPIEPPLAADAEIPTRPPSNFGAGLIENGPPRNLGRLALIGLTIIGLGAVGFFGFLLIFSDRSDGQRTTREATRADAGMALAAGDARASVQPDTPEVDAGPPLLAVTSEPSGAIVYFDGTKAGQTPITVDTAGDQHKLVVVSAGYAIHIADITGGGVLKVDLVEVTPSGGPAGIKVRCKIKGRYYVWVDDKDTGQLCPTERIEVELGAHTVEVYDPVTDTRRRFDVDVTQTRFSHRVRLD